MFTELNISGKIINQRKIKGYSQEELAQRSGISLRTIQRIEKENAQPRSYTLRTLCETLDLDFTKVLSTDESISDEQWNKLRLINLISFSTLIIPLLPLFFQSYLWYKNRSLSGVNRLGRRIISSQLIWSIGLMISISITPIISTLISGQSAVGHFPTPIVVYIGFLIINFTLSIYTASHLQHKKEDLLRSIPILF